MTFIHSSIHGSLKWWGRWAPGEGWPRFSFSHWPFKGLVKDLSFSKNQLQWMLQVHLFKELSLDKRKWGYAQGWGIKFTTATLTETARGEHWQRQPGASLPISGTVGWGIDDEAVHGHPCSKLQTLLRVMLWQATCWNPCSQPRSDRGVF